MKRISPPDASKPPVGGLADTGFTLIELMVVVAIIAMLAAFGIPQYLRAIESTKFDEAVANVRAIAAANRMCALDRNSTAFFSGTIDGTCNSGACPAGGAADVCGLVRCKYLIAQEWGTRPYVYTGADGTTTSSCGGKTFSARAWVACAARRTGANPGTNSAPYNTWGLAVDTNGAVEAVGTSPPSVTGL